MPLREGRRSDALYRERSSMQTPFSPAHDLGPPPIELGCGDGSAGHGHLFLVVLEKVAGRYA
jgi:hypothetical protein